MGDSTTRIEELVQNGGSPTKENALDQPEAGATHVLQNGEISKSEGLSRRSFRIKGLKHPGWRKSDELFDMLTSAEKFVAEFQPGVSGGKRGVLSLIFPDNDSAIRAYKLANTIRIYEKPLEVEAALDFYSTNLILKARFMSPEDELLKRTLFIFHLPLDTEDDFMSSIFGVDQMESCTFLPILDEDEKQAKIVFLSPEAAQTACDDVDGFVIDNGEHECALKAFFWDEYNTFMLNSAKLKILQEIEFEADAKNKEKQQEQPLEEESAKFEDVGDEENQEQTTSVEIEINEDDVVTSIDQLIHNKRINFSDWNGPEDIYPELDEISALYGGLPDSLLKPCLLKYLEQRLSGEGQGWMRQHLELLIKLWKKEVVSSMLYERPTRIKLQSRTLAPPREMVSKRKRPANRKELKQSFGIGMALQQARTIMTDQGEVSIDEDDDGTIKIGGEQLSFDSWAKFNKSDGLTVYQPPQPPAAPPMSQEEWEKQKYTKRMAAKARRKAKKAEKLEMMTQAEAQEETKTEAKVLEEGEVDSGEERKTKAKRLKASTSSSSSSSESDDDADGQGSRHRRRERRKKERMGTIKTAGVRLPGVLQALYDRRINLLNLLSTEHRNGFANTLNVIMSTEKVMMTPSQREMMLSKMKLMLG
ncbi:unnamed protein product, partial [Mesorhabditis belari]|uniref:Uncharacterized protein n=1 Tax=Mesorhabditis belari TaxID=2138241 RepID=A0AAF3FFP5_9BILA